MAMNEISLSELAEKIGGELTGTTQAARRITASHVALAAARANPRTTSANPSPTHPPRRAAASTHRTYTSSASAAECAETAPAAAVSARPRKSPASARHSPPAPAHPRTGDSSCRPPRTARRSTDSRSTSATRAPETPPGLPFLKPRRHTAVSLPSCCNTAVTPPERTG